MPRVTYLQTNFTAGELSPRLHGRVDIARYQNGAKALRNAQVLVQGGVRRRLGTEYLGETKDSTKISRLIPFVVNRTVAYMLEFGDLYMRVFGADGNPVETSPGVPFELVTPFTQSMLSQIDYTQGAETMFLWHSAVPTQRLQRFGLTNWAIGAAPWVHQPADEIGERIGVAGTLSLATVGAGRTLTAAAASFETADVGRTIVSGGGLATITAYTSTTQVTVNITRAFASVNLAAFDWIVGGSPVTSCTPNASSPVGGPIQLTAAANAWKSSHVGGFVRINGGLVKITGITSALVADGTILNELSGTTAAPADAWSLNFPVWNAYDGYPRTGTLWEQRLIAAGTARFPQTIWGTRTAEYLNFADGVADDDGFAFTINSDEVNPILYVAAARALLAFTYGGEFTLNGGIEKPITPTNVQIRARSNHGCSEVRPVRIGSEEVFVQRAGRKVRSFSYNVTTDDYSSPDVSILAEHLTSPSIIALAWQQAPELSLWALREDGRLLLCTYDRVEQEVIAWALHDTISDESDAFESIAVLPDDAGNEQLWAIVRRTVDGATVRLIERFSEFYPLDCALTATSFTAQTIWNGLDHLEGREVDIVADGAYAGRQTVTAGAITLQAALAAQQVTIGLPFTMRVELLDPELQGGAGSAVGNSMRTGEITLRLLDSLGGTINGQKIPTRFLGPAALNTPPVAVSGLFRIENLGWARGESPVVIEQPLPLAFTLLGVARKFSVND